MKQKILFFLLAFLAVTTSMAQSKSIKGTVVDKDSNEPVIGASILIKGTSTGTMTDVDGAFSLKVDPTSTLVVSYVGYLTKEVTVGDANALKIVLAPDMEVLEDVVVIGYGTQKKSDLTGSVASVSANDVKGLATSDLGAALQGKASGLQVLTNSGAPGEGAQIRVRGYSSNSGYLGPLMIVDGLKVDNIQYLDPSMIESVEVLKDAASAAIYGAEAGNGVILITTKKGHGNTGAPKIVYDMKFTRQSLAQKPKLFDAASFIEYKKMQGTNIENELTTQGYKGEDTDWIDEVFEGSWEQQHGLSFQDGNDKGSLFAAVKYVDNDGIVKGNKDTYRRLTGQINAEYKLYKWLTVGANTSIEKWSRQAISHMSAYGSMLAPAIMLDPLTPVYWDSPSEFSADVAQTYAQHPDWILQSEDGRYYATSKYYRDDNGNPLLQRDRINLTNDGFNVRGTAYVNLMPVKGLVVTSRFGYRINQNNSHNYTAPYFMNSQAKSEEYEISASANNGHYYQWENFANYNIDLGKNSIGAMVGMSFIRSEWDNVSASAKGPDILKSYADNFRFLDYVNGNENTVKSINNAPGKSSSISYFGRLTYSYGDRYSVQANFRADAFDASKLPKSNRWGKFPSFSAGWTISNESWFKEAFTERSISFLKLRGSWGRNGNINVLNGYRYATTVNYNSAWYQYGSSAASYGSALNGLPNPNLTWETSEQLDFGIDARFLDNRLSVSMDYFNKNTRDLLIDINPTPEVYNGTTTINAGKINNRGFEFEATWKDHIGDLYYSVSANFSTLRNRVTYLDPSVARIEKCQGGVDGTNNQVRKGFEEGHSIWYFRGYQYDGVYQEDQYDRDGNLTLKAGSPIIRDIDGDGSITDADMTDIGKAIPSVNYGITINLEYKGFDFTCFGAGAAGSKIFNVFYRFDGNPYRNSLRYYMDNAWTPTNRGGSMPDPSIVRADPVFWSSSASMFSGSYFKFKQLQLGYTLPKNITRKFAVQNLRFFVSLDDFFTISDYPGLDPETATTTNNDNAGSGFDIGTYPTTKKVSFGLSLGF